MQFHINNQKYEELFTQLRPKIYRYLYYKVQNHEEADELTQDTFRKVWTKLEKLDLSPEQIESYFYTTAKNTLYDVWRKRRVQTVNIEDVPEPVSDKGSPEDAALDEEERIKIKEAMEKLPEDQKLVLELRILEGYSSKETALRMLKTPGAVRSLQYRAIQNLKEIFKEMEGWNYGI